MSTDNQPAALYRQMKTFIQERIEEGPGIRVTG